MPSISLSSGASEESSLFIPFIITDLLSGDVKFIQSLNITSYTSGILSPSLSCNGGSSLLVKFGSVVPTFDIAGNCDTKNRPATTNTVNSSVDWERRNQITYRVQLTVIWGCTKTALIE